MVWRFFNLDEHSGSLALSAKRIPLLAGTCCITWFLFASLELQAEGRDKLSLATGDRAILTYNAAKVPSPQADAPWYGCSGFIHPVYTPSGRIVTNDFPESHLHQHGLMFAWTSARIDGRKVDFWNSREKQGHVEHAKTIRADANSIVVKLRHIDDKAASPTIVLDETWEITHVPHPAMNVFDLVSTQVCVMVKPLIIDKYHYGAMCVRGAATWSNDAAMLTSEGKDRDDGNHTRPNWVAMSGNVDGADCGIAAMSHPDNFRAPQPVRLHPNMPYFCFAPMVTGDFRIEPRKPFVSRFRFVAFDGKVNARKLDGLWQSYVAEAAASLLEIP